MPISHHKENGDVMQMMTYLNMAAFAPGIAQYGASFYRLSKALDAESPNKDAMATQVDNLKEQTTEHFEELVILDSVGRLQVPKQYREALNLHGRARMEMVDNHLVIHPVPPEELHQMPPELLHQAEEAEGKDDGRIRQWLHKIRRPQKK